MKKSISLSDENLLSLLSNSSSTGESEPVAHPYFYFANRDGSLRWVYSESLKSPTFLNFFNQSSLRSKVIKVLISIFFTEIHINTMDDVVSANGKPLKCF